MLMITMYKDVICDKTISRGGIEIYRSRVLVYYYN